MPAMIRIGGKMWGADGRPQDTKAVIPESNFLRAFTKKLLISAKPTATLILKQWVQYPTLA
jgi:monomeric isocitrate dehydrogenase